MKKKISETAVFLCDLKIFCKIKGLRFFIPCRELRLWKKNLTIQHYQGPSITDPQVCHNSTHTYWHFVVLVFRKTYGINLETLKYNIWPLFSFSCNFKAVIFKIAQRAVPYIAFILNVLIFFREVADEVRQVGPVGKRPSDFWAR